MIFLEHLILKTLKYDLTNKFLYKNTKKIPKVKKIILNFGCKTTDIKNLSASLLALELLTLKKSKLTTTRKPNIALKIRKGNPVGCKVTLQNKKMFIFLEKILIHIFPSIKNFNGIQIKKSKSSKSFSFELYDLFSFNELEEHYYLFNALPKLSITIITNSKSSKELFFIFKSIQFPIKIK
jgi:large subunit ribosomal protein L5